MTTTITTTMHKKCYQELFQADKEDFYDSSFAIHAYKHPKFFPEQFMWLVQSHPNSASVAGKDDMSREEFMRSNYACDKAALWMLTEHFYLLDPSQCDTVSKMRTQLRKLELLEDILTDEHVQMLIDLVFTDPSPYFWKH